MDIVLAILASVLACAIWQYAGEDISYYLSRSKFSGDRLKGRWTIFYSRESGINVQEMLIVHGSIGRSSWATFETTDEHTGEAQKYKVNIKLQGDNLYSATYRPTSVKWLDFGVALFRVDHDGQTAAGHSTDVRFTDGKLESRAITMHRESNE